MSISVLVAVGPAIDDTDTWVCVCIMVENTVLSSAEAVFQFCSSYRPIVRLVVVAIMVCAGGVVPFRYTVVLAVETTVLAGSSIVLGEQLEM